MKDEYVWVETTEHYPEYSDKYRYFESHKCKLKNPKNMKYATKVDRFCCDCSSGYMRLDRKELHVQPDNSNK